MKIPGIDQIVASMEEFSRMLPVLEEMNANLRTIAVVTILDSEHLDNNQKTELLRTFE